MTALWQPYWQALHAYTATAVVIPTTFTGFIWRCTTAGTSGAVEPVWPNALVNPTIADGTVTWEGSSADRQAMQTGIASLVTTFATANPTIIRTVRTVRPLNFANVNLPLFFVGDMSESITTTQGVQRRQFDGFSCYLVDEIGSIDESNDRMNFAVDALVDLFTLNPHAASGRSLVDLAGVRDTEFGEGNARYPALEFAFSVQTGTLRGRS